jgi:very-short-patch-repair endonuclease
MTDAERKLWLALRAHRLNGLSFRRQVPVGPYIVDFVCHDARLIVEVDGGQHADSVADQRRDAWLESAGYRVLRFWNNEVLGNLDGVLSQIVDAAGTKEPTPLPAAAPPPSPSRGEEFKETKR